MNSYIILNGVNSNTIAGLLIQELPSISKPKLRTNIEEIDGRDGNIVTKLGYSAYTKTFSIGLHGNFNIDDVIAYFNSDGTVVFSNESDKYYRYQIIEQIDFERLIRFRTAKIKMLVQPFKYSNIEEEIENETELIEGSGTEITLNNTIDDVFNTFDLKGNTSQETTNGVNIFDEADFARQNSSYYSYDSEDGLIIIASDGRNFDTSVTYVTAVEPNTTYYYKIDNISNLSAFQAFEYSSNLQSCTKANNFTDNGSFTTKSNTYYLKIKFFANSRPATIGHVIISETDTPYEPKSSPSPDYPQDVHVVKGDNEIVVSNGINVFDMEEYANANSSYYIYDKTTGLTMLKVDNRSLVNVGFHVSVTPNTTYYFTNDNTSNAYIGEYNSDGVWIKSNSNLVNNSSFTTSNSTSYLIVKLGNDNYSSYPKLIGNAYISKNISYQETIYPLYLGVKNFFNKNDVTLNYRIDPSGTTISENGYFTSNFIQVNSNTQYTKNSPTEDAYHRFAFYSTADVSGFISVSTSNTITTPNNCKYIRFCGLQTEIDTTQLEKGSTSHSYTPYGANLIELYKIGDYQDYIYKDNGKWYKHQEIVKTVCDGTVIPSSTFNGTNTTRFMYTNFLSENLKTFADCTTLFCSHLIGNLVWSPDVEGMYINQRSLVIRVNNSIATTSGEISEWLSENNLIIYYPLATPQEIEITDTSLISQLNNLSNALSYEGQTKITQENSDLPFYLDVSVYGDTSITITNSGNINSKPIFTIYGSDDIAMYLNGVQIFQISLGDEEYITIDTENMNAYKDSTLKNRLVTGNYNNFSLLPGENEITFSGRVLNFKIENYSRWL